MNPNKVRRDQLVELTDLPNIGARTAAALVRIGINRLADLVGHNAFELYRTLCQAEGKRLDPCVLDVCLSITRFIEGEDPQPWWAYTAERKQRFPRI